MKCGALFGLTSAAILVRVLGGSINPKATSILVDFFMPFAVFHVSFSVTGFHMLKSSANCCHVLPSFFKDVRASITISGFLA